MSQQYYKFKVGWTERVEWEDLNTSFLEPVDIGWRLCRDELPEKDDYYAVKLNVDMENKTQFGLFCSRRKQFLPYEDGVIQWCKLPEPFKEGE